MSDDEAEMAAMRRKLGMKPRHQPQVQNYHPVVRGPAQSSTFIEEFDSDIERAPTATEPDVAAVMGFNSFGGRQANASASQYDSRDGNQARNMEMQMHKKRARPDADLDSVNAVNSAAHAVNALIPSTHEARLSGHRGCALAVAWDRTGNILLTGGSDYKMSVFEFNRMNELLNPIREKEPEDGHPVQSLSLSKTGHEVLVITGSAKARVLSLSDLSRLGETVRGDPYLRDLGHTSGHVSGIIAGMWNPMNNAEFITCGEDGTIRVWTQDKLTKNKAVIKFKDASGQRIPVTAISYSHDGKFIAGACKNGSIAYWKSAGPYTRPTKEAKHAHSKGTETSGLVFSADDKVLFSRGGDHSVKAWSVRTMKLIAETDEKLVNEYAETGLCLSPDGKTLLTGTASRDKDPLSGGELCIVDVSSVNSSSSGLKLHVLQRVRVMDRALVKMLWHPLLNQIACIGLTTAVLYDPQVSKKGVMLCATKSARKVVHSVSAASAQIVNPHSVLDRPTVKRRRRDEEDPNAARPRQPPRTKHGGSKGGNIVEYGSTATQHYMKQLMPQQEIDLSLNVDPRERLLSFDAQARASNKYTGNAYAHTQPQKQFAERTKEEIEYEKKHSELVGNKREK